MKTFVRKNLNYIVFLNILILLITLKAINPSFIKSVSYLSFDLYQKVFVEEKDSEVIIIDIDLVNFRGVDQFLQKYLISLIHQTLRQLVLIYFLQRKINNRQKK